jgi:hypothetical protein
VIYHYCLREDAAKILAASVIRPANQTVYREMMDPILGRPGIVLEPPIVWFTINPIFDGVIALVRGTLAGHTIDEPDWLWRFVLPDSLTDESLPEWAERHGHNRDLFACMVQTGDVVGSNYTTWRLCERPILESEWQAVQKWDGKGGWLHAGQP